MKFVAIDPGTRESAWMLFDTELYVHGGPVPGQMGIEPNVDVGKIVADSCDLIACEWIESMGMAVGKEVFETVAWTGRYWQAAAGRFHRVTRRECKLHLCGSSRAKDPNVRRALLDLYPSIGGGVTPQVGTRKKPGPLFGMRSHLWSALAVAVTFCETRIAEGRPVADPHLLK